MTVLALMVHTCTTVFSKTNGAPVFSKISFPVTRTDDDTEKLGAGVFSFLQLHASPMHTNCPNAKLDGNSIAKKAISLGMITEYIRQ